MRLARKIAYNRLYRWMRKASWALLAAFYIAPVLPQEPCGETVFLTQQPDDQMLRLDMLVFRCLGLLGGIGERSLALFTERKINGKGYWGAARRSSSLDIFANSLNRNPRLKRWMFL